MLFIISYSTNFIFFINKNNFRLVIFYLFCI